MIRIQGFSILCRAICLSVLSVATFLSIIVSQVYSPSYFSLLGKQKSTLTAFLRAAVKMGDNYLIKNAFHDSLLAEYPVVFDTYLQESEWLERLHAVESRSAQSRDVLGAIAILYDRMGNKQKAMEYYEKIKSIDPLYQLQFSE